MANYQDNKWTLVYDGAISENAEDAAALITQPLLMMVGDVADTRYMTEDIFAKVSSEDKELTLIPGASHIEAYWKPEYVDAEEAALVEFFGRVL